MDHGGVNFRYRGSPKSSSSDRFLGVFSPPASESSISDGGDELHEDDVFWTGDVSESKRRQSAAEDGVKNRRRGQVFLQPEKFGILAALPDDDSKPEHPVILRQTSFPSSPTISFSPRTIPSIAKPPIDLNYSQSLPSKRFQQSAPMNVPMMPRKPTNNSLVDVDIDEDGDNEILPPHEIVARGSANSPRTTFSVLEGEGRTLKGRDLRQVRNAVWRQTGFLD